MIFHTQPSTPWGPFDFKLLEAYQMMQEEVCPECGHPVWLCRSTSNLVEFPVKETYCHAKRALEAHRDNTKPLKERAKGADKKEWGRILYTTPSTPKNIPDATLPTRKEFFDTV